MTDKQRIAQFNRTLFQWHKKNYRAMKWRDTSDPYHILVSEIMLQQTQVARVREKYAEFIKKFPTVKKLAQAPLREVLVLWSGLGYNRRAKYLHQCAKEVAVKYSGKFPNTYEELAALPAIGRSTAGALLAFSFGHDTPMIDTNIRRILSRAFFKKSIPSDKELYAFASSIIPRGKGRAWNYAMLDLGATLCTARGHSDECPLSGLHGAVSDFIYKKPQKKFAGSDRFYRGKLLRHLILHKRILLSVVPKILELPEAKTAPIIKKLIAEKLIEIHGTRISLPES